MSNGQTLWAWRAQPEDWSEYIIGKPLDDAEGGAGSVFKVKEPADTDPPLVAKLYNEEIINLIRTDPLYSQRILFTAENRAYLNTGFTDPENPGANPLDNEDAALPFAVWPRRLLFTVKDPKDVETARESLVGFTMPEMISTISLWDIIRSQEQRRLLSTSNTMHIAITMAHQLSKLHRHPWKFVFGDMSPNNIHVSRDYRQVLFIDTDSFQFDYNHDKYSFKVPGFTEGYIAPEAAQTGDRVTPEHDDFVLAIHIFQLIMSTKGWNDAHPFRSPGFSPDTLIAERAFAFDEANGYPVNKGALATYKALPEDLRAAFTKTFTEHPPITAADWIKILRAYRGSLQ